MITIDRNAQTKAKADPATNDNTSKCAKKTDRHVMWQFT
jgi:hypothetical protein